MESPAPILITEGAKTRLKQMMSEQHLETVRLFIEGFG